MANIAEIITDLVTDAPALVAAVNGVQAAIPGLESKDVGQTIDAIVAVLTAIKPLAVEIAAQAAPPTA